MAIQQVYKVISSDGETTVAECKIHPELDVVDFVVNPDWNSVEVLEEMVTMLQEVIRVVKEAKALGE